MPPRPLAHAFRTKSRETGDRSAAERGQVENAVNETSLDSLIPQAVDALQDSGRNCVGLEANQSAVDIKKMAFTMIQSNLFQ